MKNKPHVWRILGSWCCSDGFLRGIGDSPCAAYNAYAEIKKDIAKRWWGGV